MSRFLCLGLQSIYGCSLRLQQSTFTRFPQRLRTPVTVAVYFNDSGLKLTVTVVYGYHLRLQFIVTVYGFSSRLQFTVAVYRYRLQLRVVDTVCGYNLRVKLTIAIYDFTSRFQATFTANGYSSYGSQFFMVIGATALV